MIAPSAQWQQWIFIAAAAWLLFEMWRGWHLGLIRGVLKIIILILAWLAASASAAATTAALAIFLQKPSSFIPTMVAALVGFAIYFLGAFLSGLLLKKTEHHHGVLRTILGIGGACCGLLFGLFFLWGGISLIRSLGLFGEMRVLEAQRKGCPLSNDSMACHFIRLEKSLEMGPTGQFLISSDPLSPVFYENTRKSITVMEDSYAFQRFLHAPNTQELLRNPAMNRFLHDPNVQEGIRLGNILSLFQDPAFQNLFRDPSLRKQFQEFNLSAALDYALEKSVKDKERLK